MLLRRIILLQAVYYIITGGWPLIDIDSFMFVTGSKTDLWLVKMVGLLSLVIGIALVYYYAAVKDKIIGGILGIGASVSFILIDVIYATKDVISNIYLSDSAVQIVFLMVWFIYLLKKR